MNPTDIRAGAARAIDPDWVARARALAPLLDAAAPRIEAARELPGDVLDALHEAKMFRMLLPRALDGAELELSTFFDVVCTIAAGDASTAWCVTQNSGCSMSAAYLDPAAAREIFADPRAVLAWGYPTGPCLAEWSQDGWRVTGTWSFGSGNRHAAWLGGHCKLRAAGGGPMTGAHAGQGERTMLFPRTAANVLPDSWNVIGLRGTGSDTYSVSGLLVPHAHAIVQRATGRDQHQSADATTQDEPERRERGTLYRFAPTTVYQTGFAAVGLGIARAMLDAFIAFASSRTLSSANTPLRDNASIQSRIAQAEARIESSRAWVRQLLRDAWHACAESGRLGYEHRIQLRLASTWAIRQAREVVEACYGDAGASAIFEGNPFERRLRDMHAVSQQIQASPMHFQSVGDYRLGGKPGNRYL